MLNFERRLDMKEGVLHRIFRAQMKNGRIVEVSSRRMYHLFQSDTASLQYTLRIVNADAAVPVCSYLNGDVVNRDSNYGESFWTPIAEDVRRDLVLITETKKHSFAYKRVCGINFTSVMLYKPPIVRKKKRFYVGDELATRLKAGQTLRIEKYVAIISSTKHQLETLSGVAQQSLEEIVSRSYGDLLRLQAKAWAHIWEESDIQIEGDIAAQQAIRFNIFQLNQTYTGEDFHLNIGPKGFTGEKYGEVTYWDTEAFCLPFYLATQEPRVARNLLLYRYHHLQKAIENASKLGFENGAALYPMVTINGEECHNEWEITFEEIHRLCDI